MIRHCLSIALVSGLASFASLAEGRVLDKTAHGKAPLKSINVLAFAPEGVLLIGDGSGAQVVAVSTGDTERKTSLDGKIDNIQAKMAEKFGAPAEGIEILDLAVNPASGVAYVAVRKQDDKSYAILTIEGQGRIGLLDLDSITYACLPLAADKSPVNKITDLAWADDRVIVAGAANEEFASKIYLIRAPLADQAPGQVHSAETYHVSHHRWETKAPMSAVIPYREEGKLYVVGAFACTPVVKYEVNALAPGAKVQGQSVIELGSGNRPLDMFSYTKDGHEYVLANTFRFHHAKKPLGPSPYWTVRFDRDLLAEHERINEKAAVRQSSDPAAAKIEMVAAYNGVMQMDQLDAARALVLRTDDAGKVSLETIALP